MRNAFTTNPDLTAALESGTTQITLCVSDERDAASAKRQCASAEIFQTVDDGLAGFFSRNIYISSLELKDSVLDACIEYALKNKNVRVLTDACRTLGEVGRFDYKFNLSPVMLLHKIGLLSGFAIVGGVYLDKDDLSLMAQENTSLILTPTFDSGSGHGIAPLKSYVTAGINISLGTADNSFNKTADLKKEAELLYFLTSASMNMRDCVPLAKINSFL